MEVIRIYEYFMTCEEAKNYKVIRLRNSSADSKIVMGQEKIPGILRGIL